MVRIRVAAEALKKSDPPPRRARTAPIPADKERTPVTRVKRARSETIEPTRSSKRLRGIAAVAIVVEEEDDVVVLPGGWSAGEKKSDSPKRDFTRTISTETSSTAPDPENRTPTSSAPDTRTRAIAVAPISQDEPTNSQVSTSTIADDMDIPSLPMPTSPVVKPLYRNVPPPPVLIDGHPSLRVVFREMCLYRYRAPSPIHEWQSQHFFQQISNPMVRAEHEQNLARDGVVFVPRHVILSTSRNGTHHFPLDSRVFGTLCASKSRVSDLRSAYRSCHSYSGSSTHLLVESLRRSFWSPPQPR